MKPVLLRDVVNELDCIMGEAIAYINRRTGELHTVDGETLSIIEDGDQDDDNFPDWQKEMLPKAREVVESDDSIALPDRFEIHEYSIMQRFCCSVKDPDLEDDLLSAIRGSGAFRRFKDLIHRREIQDDWYRYRSEALAEIAADFLEAEGIPFIRDARSEPEA